VCQSGVRRSSKFAQRVETFEIKNERYVSSANFVFVVMCRRGDGRTRLPQILCFRNSQGFNIERTCHQERQHPGLLIDRRLCRLQ